MAARRERSLFVCLLFSTKYPPTAGTTRLAGMIIKNDRTDNDDDDDNAGPLTANSSACVLAGAADDGRSIKHKRPGSLLSTSLAHVALAPIRRLTSGDLPGLVLSTRPIRQPRPPPPAHQIKNWQKRLIISFGVAVCGYAGAYLSERALVRGAGRLAPGSRALVACGRVGPSSNRTDLIVDDNRDSLIYELIMWIEFCAHL